jgi:hypothetical protein
MTTMLKRLNFLNLTLFLLISFVAPYISAKGASLAFSQNPEECSKSVEKDFFDNLGVKHLVSFGNTNLIILTLSFPTYLALKPQNSPDDFLRPPRFS